MQATLLSLSHSTSPCLISALPPPYTHTPPAAPPPPPPTSSAPALANPLLDGPGAGAAQQAAAAAPGVSIYSDPAKALAGAAAAAGLPAGFAALLVDAAAAGLSSSPGNFIAQSLTHTS